MYCDGVDLIILFGVVMPILNFYYAFNASIGILACHSCYHTNDAMPNAKVCEMLMLAYASMAYAKCQMPWQEC